MLLYIASRLKNLCVCVCLYVTELSVALTTDQSPVYHDTDGVMESVPLIDLGVLVKIIYYLPIGLP